MAVIELVHFRTESIADDAFLRAAADIDRLLTREPEFKTRWLARKDDGEWIDFIVWDTMEAARSAAARIPRAPEAAAFMSPIVGASVRMGHYVVQDRG